MPAFALAYTVRCYRLHVYLVMPMHTSFFPFADMSLNTQARSLTLSVTVCEIISLHCAEQDCYFSHARMFCALS